MPRLISAFVCLLLPAILAPGHAAPAITGNWASYADLNYGFSIGYPRSVFRPVNTSLRRGGRIFASPDGRARLLVGAFANETGETMTQYRDFVLRHSYAGARIDYAPVRASFFVLSGRRGKQHFYERVSFTCNGDVINSWAMIYPDAERAFFDPLVEAVARSYRPGSRPCR